MGSRSGRKTAPAFACFVINMREDDAIMMQPYAMV